MDKEKIIKYTSAGVRWILGLIFFLGGLSYFFMKEIPLDLTTPGGQYMAALLATGFFLPFLKIVETLAGLMLFFKRWTPLALIILAPIIIQILLYFIFLDLKGLIFGIPLVIFAGFLAWVNWDKYAGLFKA